MSKFMAHLTGLQQVLLETDASCNYNGNHSFLFLFLFFYYKANKLDCWLKHNSNINHNHVEEYYSVFTIHKK